MCYSWLGLLALHGSMARRTRYCRPRSLLLAATRQPYPYRYRYRYRYRYMLLPTTDYQLRTYRLLLPTTEY